MQMPPRLGDLSLRPGDLSLRDAILAGDRLAAEGFCRRHLGALYEFVHYRVGGNRALAEDLVQDTFLTALERLSAFDGRSNLHTWLCGIARNKIRSQRRRVRPALMEDVLAEADPEIEAILLAIDRSPLPEHVLEREETKELVGATLGSLPPDYREALVQKYETYPPTVREFSSPDGAWRWDSPPAGKQRVFVHAPDFALLALGELEPSGAPPVLRAELEPGDDLRGSVVDHRGDPVPGALVISEADAPTDGLYFMHAETAFWLPVRARTGPDGRFELRHLNRGTHTLRASAPGLATGWLAGVDVPAAPGDELVLRLGPGGTVAGRVTREDGGPWADAELVVVAMDQSQRPRTNFALTTTDAEGRYRVEHLPPLLMIVVLLGEPSEVRPVTVREGQVVTANFTARPPGARVHGRVLDAAGRPVAGQNVGLFDRRMSSWTQNWVASTTAADGGYAFLGVAPGGYEIFLIDEMGRGVRCVDRIDLGSEPELEHDVHVPAGRLTVHVRAAATGEAAADTAVVLVHEDERGGGSFFAAGNCDARGTFTFVDLASGAYLAVAYPTRPDLGYAWSERLVVDPARPAPEAEILLEAGGPVTVRVSDGQGRPLEHAAVTIHDEEGGGHSFSRMPFTDAQGRFRACGLRPGRYRVHVQLDGYRGTPASFRYELGRELEVPVVLSPLPPR